MELSCVASPRGLYLFPSSSASSGCGFCSRDRRKVAGWSRINASTEGSPEPIHAAGANKPPRRDFAGGGPAMDVSASPVSSGTTSTTGVERSLAGGEDDDFSVLEKVAALVRLGYGIGLSQRIPFAFPFVVSLTPQRLIRCRKCMDRNAHKESLISLFEAGIYGAMALASKVVCSISGTDWTGAFHPSPEAIVGGLCYAAPPIVALLFILDDEVVKHSPHARAIRDAEDEELQSFFHGMSPWQLMLIVTASSIGEELFYRVAVQGTMADVFLRGTELMKDTHGVTSLTGVLPLFAPFARAFAAAITAAVTGSLYYVATAANDPTYVAAPVLSSTTGREDLKKLLAAWCERRQMKKIYSPLLEGLLALYLGFEWIQVTHNILAPMITHGMYSAVLLGHGLCRIHDGERQVRVGPRNSKEPIIEQTR
ncbi:hypothetical protein MUK42_05584 [Musa troglodytarum]|uniref:CAAX amino terminal protease n=1 Tax=Musa troglodytarum TaxID=320322 RepID=A0A9E7EPL4_9LILI|nr:hypothetical protein MUK42_05584 [Musa troglodytarum]